ncbi:MAG: LysR family transcriptional regulator [Deltaproteobacteria bacterium]|nr:LysR family transcriptional regulator [Myxococcales bacterium]MDP3220855.1 LysR family transcriptional regulator [Deltaproteobacteria bacterium]
MSPTVDQLRTFLTIAETLSFRAAARSLVVAPAVVSERVRQLEAALGAPLFRRTTRSVALTPQGQALIPYARRAVDAMLDCAHAAGERLPAPRAELVLGVEPEAAARWVAPLLSRWARLRPELTVHLHVGDHDALHAALVRHQIDAAVLGPTVRDPRLLSAPLVGLAWRMVAAPVALRRQALRVAEDASGFTLLDRAPSLPCLRPWLDAAPPRLREVRFGRVLHLGSLAAIERVALEGGGVAVLPTPMIARHLEADALRPVFAAVQPSTAQHFAARLDDPRRPMLDAVAALLRDAPWTG